MTGQGRSEVRSDAGVLVVELRSVNNRGLKLVLRTNEAASKHEGEINRIVSESIQRGTVTVQASLKPPPGEDGPKINIATALAYASQLGEVAHQYVDLPVSRSTAPPSIELTNLLNLPGVLGSAIKATDEEDEARQLSVQTLVNEGVSSAIERFNEMRHHEAVSMAKALQSDLKIIDERSTEIEKLAPLVIDRYRDRLLTQIQKTLSEHSIDSEAVDIIREVQVFADRSDISEEITRLASHVELFTSVLVGRSGDDANGKTEAVGRKLDFIIQEMFRETNTIGSKANNAEIAGHVVEVKCAIERMRELVQNLE